MSNNGIYSQPLDTQSDPSLRNLPLDHPLHAYLKETTAFINLLYNEPELLNQCQELDFFKRAIHFFLANSKKRSTSKDGLKENNTLKSTEDTHVNNDFVDITTNEEGEIDQLDSESYWDEEENIPNIYHPSRNLQGTDYVQNITESELNGENDAKTDLSEENSSIKDRDIDTYECVIIGAGPAGVGVGVSLVLGGMKRSNMLILEKNTVGFSFDSWNDSTRFISPSWFSNPFGPVDLNAVDPFSTVAAVDRCSQGSEKSEKKNTENTPPNNKMMTINGNTQYPSGKQYAEYLRQVACKHKLPIRENSHVVDIEKIPGTDAWPAGGFKIKVLDMNETNSLPGAASYSKVSMVIYSRYLVWCGGEWSYPKLPSLPPSLAQSCLFQENSYLHYAEMSSRNLWSVLVHRAKQNPVPLLESRSQESPIKVSDGKCEGITGSVAIIVGGYEAGVDTACEFITLGVDQVVLVDSEDFIQGWECSGISSTQHTYSLDPSKSLAPASIYRLNIAYESGKLQILPSQICIETVFDNASKSFVVKLMTKDDDKSPDIRSIFSSIPIIFCTGFDTLQASALERVLSPSSVTRGPDVSCSCDESSKAPGLFICGPMLRHVVNPPSDGDSCEDVIKYSSHADLIKKCDHQKKAFRTETNEYKEIIFCFIYKFRTRFALVAGEILSRLIYEDHCIDDGTGDQPGYHSDRKKKLIAMDNVGHDRLERVEKMLNFYRDRGMLMTDITCEIHCDISGMSNSHC